MALFLYKARDRNGNFHEGKVESDLLLNAVRKLQHSGLFLVEIKPERQKIFFSREINSIWLPKVKLKDLALFCRQLSFMLETGFSLEFALQANIDNQSSSAIKRLSQNLLKEIRQGRSFGDACASYSQEIPPVMKDLIITAEVGGFLEKVLARLADYFDKEIETREKLKTAMVYPVLVVVIALLVINVIFIFVVPVFAGILEDLNAPLPIGTKIILAVGLFFNQYWYLLFWGVLIFFITLFLYFKSLQGKKQLDKFLLKIPFFKELNQKVIVARFCRTLANLLQSGVPLDQALKVVEMTIGNMVWRREIKKAIDNIKKGRSLIDSFKESSIFPSLLVQMLSVGEQSGNLDNLLMNVGSYYDHDVVETAERLPKLIEPVLLILVGIVVGLIVLGVLFPMFSVINGI